MKTYSLIIFSITLITFAGFAQTQPLVENSSEAESLFACSMFNGSMIHKFDRKNDVISGYIAFPVYLKLPSDEEIEASKKEWREWDPNSGTPPPADPRKIGVAVPVENSNVMTFDAARIESRVQILEKLFPPTEQSEFIPFETGKLFLKFAPDSCSIIEMNDFMSITCETSSPQTINDVKVDRILFNMHNSQQTQIIEDGEKQHEIKIKNIVNVDLMFAIEGTNQRSSFTYEPNGQGSQCSVRGRKLTKFEK